MEKEHKVKEIFIKSLIIKLLGLTEEEIIKNVKIITDKVIEQERLARKYLAKNAIELEDRVYRSYGILTICYKTYLLMNVENFYQM